MRHTGSKRVCSIQSLREGSEQLYHPIPSESAWGKSLTKPLNIGEDCLGSCKTTEKFLFMIEEMICVVSGYERLLPPRGRQPPRPSSCVWWGYSPNNPELTSTPGWRVQGCPVEVVDAHSALNISQQQHFCRRTGIDQRKPNRTQLHSAFKTGMNLGLTSQARTANAYTSPAVPAPGLVDANRGEPISLRAAL